MLKKEFWRVLNLTKRTNPTMQGWANFTIGATIGLAFLATSASAATFFGSRLTHEPTPAETCRADAAL